MQSVKLFLSPINGISHHIYVHKMEMKYETLFGNSKVDMLLRNKNSILGNIGRTA